MGEMGEVPEVKYARDEMITKYESVPELNFNIFSIPITFSVNV